MVDKGIVHLFKNISLAAEAEKKFINQGMVKHKDLLKFKDEAWLLKLPNVEKFGIDNLSEKISSLTYENTELSLKKFIKENNSVILEIGASNCWVTAELAKNNYCIAIDILSMPPDGLEAGEVFIKNRNVYFERILADMISLPFKEGVFDYVLISSSIHHSSDIKKTLSEIYRILKPDGRLILLNEPSSGVFGNKRREQVELDKINGINENIYAINEWKRYFFNANFKEEIFLPENLESVLFFKGGVYKKLAELLKINAIKKIAVDYMKIFILKFFDGYFNAVLLKKK